MISETVSKLVVAERGEQEAGDDRRARGAGAADAEHEAGAGRAGVGREAARESGVVADDRRVEEEHRQERRRGASCPSVSWPMPNQATAIDAEQRGADRRALDVPLLVRNSPNSAPPMAPPMLAYVSALAATGGG